MAALTRTPTHEEQQYDRLKEVKSFDDSKMGVKGLVDSGITTIPRIFIHPPETLSTLTPTFSNPNNIPVIDLSDQRSSIVRQIACACREFGFFQIINHGIPLEIMDQTIKATKRFHEQPPEVKSQIYGREMNRVFFYSNFDLFQTDAANWHDTLGIRLNANPPVDPAEIPEACRNEFLDWTSVVNKLGELLFGLLSEGLGINTGRLTEVMCLKAVAMAAHYYPYCPQPELTCGIRFHTDPVVLTILLQDQIGGLQMKHDNKWVDVKPVPGALIVNVGDILQVLSNGEYVSGEHRVLANPFQTPRISVGVFFNPRDREYLCGPLPELISPNKPALYRQFNNLDFFKLRRSKEFQGKPVINYFRL